MIDAGINRSQSVGAVVVAEKPKNNTSRNEKSDRTCALSRESLE